MGQANTRNIPCPCGSGKKHKNCCLGKAPPALRRKRAILPGVVILLGIAGGIYFGLAKGWGTGATMIVAGLIVAALVWVVRDPPPPSGNSGAASINFGG